MNYRLTKASEANARMTRVCENCKELYAYHRGWDECCPHPTRYLAGGKYFIEGQFWTSGLTALPLPGNSPKLDGDRILRRAHNYLVIRGLRFSGDSEACNLLWRIHVEITGRGIHPPVEESI